MPSHDFDSEDTSLMDYLRAALRVIAKAALVVAFYGLFMPAGFLMRLFKGDPLRRHFDRSSSTYYEPSKKRARDHMDRPY